MSRRYLIFSALISLLIISCATKPDIVIKEFKEIVVDDNASATIDNETIQSIIDNNSYYPIYAGKALIEFFDGQELHKISSLIKKDESNIEIKFLGMFNLVAGTLSYINGKVDYNSSNNSDITINKIFEDYDVAKILSFIDSKTTTPYSNDFSYIDTDSSKVLIADDKTITVNKDTFKVESFNDREYFVIYTKEDNGKIKKVSIGSINTNIYIAIIFQNMASWKISNN